MLKTGDKLHGFTVTRVRENEEIHGRMVEMTYDKTGTELVWLDNKEENKLFSITFRTFPEDSTGVFHILEHSTLCGSKKFPVREPFVELLKSSMNTFLNAMTFSDKTMYPVSSRNEKDFMNLTEVYLDAVFAPRLLEDPNIFYQEGHHTEIEGDHLIYKGVVFNEMKGAMSSVDRVIGQKVESMLYPDNSYGFNSGGDPAVIPDLTYEHYCDTYRRFYHPTNARIYLDGDVPVDKVLALIAEYLAPFDKAESVPEITAQVPKGSEETIYFEAAQGEPLENRGRLSFAKLVEEKDVDRRVLSGVMGAVCDVLCGSNEAPLARAVLESGLAQDVYLGFNDEDYQMSLNLGLINVKDGSEEELTKLVFDTMQSVLEKGLDPEAVNASINNAEFHAREKKEPAAIYRCIGTLSGNWLFGGDPMDGITYDDVFAALRELAANGKINEIAKDVLLNRENMVVLHAYPSTDAGEKLRKAEEERLKKEQAAMTEADMEALKQLNEALTKWQATEDKPEDLAKLPSLTLEDVDPEGRYPATAVSEEAGVTKLFHEVNCHGIKYVTLYFSLTDKTQEQLTALQFAGNMFGTLPTAKYDPLQLENQIKNVFGTLDFALDSFSHGKDVTATRPMLKVRFSYLDENKDKAIDLLLEIMQNTCLDRVDRIREFVMQKEEASKQIGARMGHVIAMSAAASHYTATAAASEAYSGYTAVRYLHDLAGNFDARVSEFIKAYEDVRDHVFCREKLILSVSGSEDTGFERLIESLPMGEEAPEKACYTSPLPMKMGLRVPAQISFATRGYHAEKADARFNGSMHVASHIISYVYLWNQVRVQGGAYGCGLRTNANGSINCYSYRDPTPARTLGIYGGMADFLREFVSQNGSLDSNIIATVGDIDPLLGPAAQGALGDAAYLTDTTVEDMKEMRARILSTTKEDMLAFADILEKMDKESAVCVCGHDAALKECGEMEIFDL